MGTEHTTADVRAQTCRSRIPNSSARNLGGFTLLEMMLSIAVLVIIMSIGTSIYYSFAVRNELDLATSALAQNLRRAQLLASASYGDVAWSVHVGGNGTITVYRGDDYATRDPAFDEDFELSHNITPNGLTDVTFAKHTGLPTVTGATTFTSSTNEQRTITINSAGTVSF